MADYADFLDKSIALRINAKAKDDDFNDLFDEKIDDLIEQRRQSEPPLPRLQAAIPSDMRHPPPKNVNVDLGTHDGTKDDSNVNVFDHSAEADANADREMHIGWRIAPKLSHVNTQEHNAEEVIVRAHAILQIEGVFVAITKSLLDNCELVITLRKRPSALPVFGSIDSAEQFPVLSRKISFPGKSAREALRFAVLVRILELMHQALTSRIVTTKRDIFYKDPALFRDQSVVNRFVDDITYTFDVPRSPLYVAAAAKGLAAGAFKIILSTGNTIDGRSAREGLLITHLKRDDEVYLESVKWILVIEKEAVFQSLVSSHFWHVLQKDGILITGKGYPDIATRALLRRLACPSDPASAPISVWGLVDYDPDGLGILSTYKHGSVNLSHENKNLVVPSIQWLGLRSKDISEAQNARGQYERDQNQGLLFLSARDRRKATKMLEWPVIDDLDGEEEWRRELQVMLMLNVKAEIQLIDNGARGALTGGIQSWLAKKLGVKWEAWEICDDV